ncbi:MAG: non-DNA binding response regulator [Paenibacillaceae bacterium]|jgi:CheY-like chemotaxis protein|nr:non-DNA binding response regulator [Paenibacillaceae bacterium]
MNTVYPAESGLTQRLFAQVNDTLKAPWTECGVIAASTHGINRHLLHNFAARLNKDGENPAVQVEYEEDTGCVVFLLPGQSLASTHFTALSAKNLLQDADLLIGGMSVAGFSESDPPTEKAMNDFVSFLDGSEPSEIAVYHGQPRASEAPTVVMIDPNADLLEFLNIRLGLQGYDVMPAQDGKEGLRLVASFQPDLVITELALPALDGYQIIHRIRNSPNRDCQVVVLTDQAVEQDICKCFELGAADVIKKPFSPKELEARLKRLLN